MIFYYFLFYVFMLPLEYIQYKVPKGPTGINYQTLSLLVLLVWLLVGQRRMTAHGTVIKSVSSPMSLPLVAMIAINFFCRAITGSSIPLLQSVLDPTSSNFSQFLQFMNGFLLFWIVLKLIHNRKHLNWILLAIVASSPLVFRAFRSDMGSAYHFINELRGKGPFVNVGSNELAAFFVYNGTFFLVYFMQEARQWWPRLVYLMPGGFYAYGTMYSYSRGAWLAFVAAIALSTLRHRLLLVALIVAGITAPMWLPQSVKDRYNMTEDEQGQLESSAESRVVFHAKAIEMWEESPLIGNGIGSFRARIGMDTHGMYHRTLAEQGVVGFIIFAWLWATVLFIGGRLWLQARDPKDRQYGFALMIATVGLMIANIFGDRFTHLPMIGQYWILVGIAGRLYANMVGVASLDDEPMTEKETAHAEESRQQLNVVKPAGEQPFAIGTKPQPQPQPQPVPQALAKPAAELNIVGKPKAEAEKPKPELNLVGRDRRE